MKKTTKKSAVAQTLVITENEFKGHKMICLDYEGGKFPFQFGLNKAKLVLDCMDVLERIEPAWIACGKDINKIRVNLSTGNDARVSLGEFKGNPMMVLRRTDDDRYPFQFGLGKAILCTKAKEEITIWVDKVSQSV